MLNIFKNCHKCSHKELNNLNYKEIEKLDKEIGLLEANHKLLKQNYDKVLTELEIREQVLKACFSVNEVKYYEYELNKLKEQQKALDEALKIGG